MRRSQALPTRAWRFLRRTDWPLIPVTLAILGFGLIMQWSVAGGREIPSGHIIRMAAAGFCGLVAAMLPAKFWRTWAWPSYLGCLFLLVVVLVAGDATEDSDRDGLDNLAEYQAGTDPRDAASVFQLQTVRLANGRLELRFNAARAGQLVVVQSTRALGQAGWETVIEQVAEEAGPQQVEVDVSDSGGQFFRLLLTE